MASRAPDAPSGWPRAIAPPFGLTRYAQQVKALGGIPVLVTPLTRRSFVGGVLQNNLVPWADVIRATAKAQQVALLDLNADSFAAVQAMGSEQADTFAVEPPPAKKDPAALTAGNVEVAGAAKSAFDYTHLGPKGAAYFAGMVVDEMKTAVPAAANLFIAPRP